METINVLCLAIFLVSSWGRSEAATMYSCKKETDGGMTMKFRSNDYAEVLAWEPSVGGTNCAATTDGAYQLLTIKTDSLRDQTSPDPSTNDCKVVKPGDATETTYNVFHYLNTGFFSPGDGYYILTCDTDTANDAYVTVDPATSVTVTIASAALNPITAGHVLELVDSTTLTVLTSVAVNDPVKLKFTYTRTLDEEAVSQGTHVKKVQASGLSDYSVVHDILDENGCPALVTGAPLYCATGFIDDTTNTDPTKFISFSPEIIISAFRGSTELYFRVEYDDICPLGTENRCYDIAAYCDSLRRKRRSSGNGPSSGNVTTSVKVNFGSGSTAGQGGKEGENVQTDEPFCRETYKFWIVAIVLGALLLLAMLFAIYLYFRLRREQRTNEKIANRVGFSNPSVQS